MMTLAIHDSIRHKVQKNTKKLFFVFYQPVGVQQEINIMYLQFVKIRLQLLHSYAFKIISIPYSYYNQFTRILKSYSQSLWAYDHSSSFNPLNHQQVKACISFKSVRLLMNQVLFLDTIIH